MLLKKILAILFLSIYLFNLIGYSFLFQYLIEDANTQLVQRLDKNIYDKTDLVEVKLPMSLPYLSDMKNFERVDGQVELNGIHYNYVQRKMAHDTLYLLCLPNFAKTDLYNAKADFEKNNSDNPTSKKNPESPIKKLNVGRDYNIVTESFDFTSKSLPSASKDNFLCSEILSVFIKAPSQPPDFRC